VSEGVSRSALYALYALIVAIWSSTWVAIKIGLEDCPPLLGAGLRFTLAGVLLIGFALLSRRPLRTDRVLVALLAVFPFAIAYGLVYWGEQYIPSGLTAVLFGVMPLYTALMGAVLLHDEPLRARLLLGVAIALGGLMLAFAESLDLGEEDLAWAGALAVVLAPLGAAVGNIATKRRDRGRLDAIVVNGWGMLAGGLLLLAGSGVSESWSEAAWSADAVGSITYLAIVGSAVPFVVLMVLLRHMRAQTLSFVAMLIPFGALVLGALIESEPITAEALGGAALVAAGLLVAQAQRRAEDPSGVAPAAARADDVPRPDPAHLSPHGPAQGARARP
jgi:drug/metabolite transporter (DMT)-like permease